MTVGISDGKIVSVGSISGMAKSRFAHNAELGISVLKDYWGRGIGCALMAEFWIFALQNNI